MFSSDPANLFAQLFDLLDVDVFRNPEAEGWLSHPAVEDIAFAIQRSADSGVVDADLVDQFVDGDDEGRNTFAVLLGLDLLLEQALPETASYDLGALDYIHDRYVATGRLDTGEHGGAVLPRFVSPSQQHAFPESLHDAFANLVRIPPDAWERADHVNLVLDTPFAPRAGRNGLTVACLPFSDSLDDFTFGVADHHGEDMYAIGADAAALAARISEALDVLDASGSLIAVVPELTLDGKLLAEWQSVVRSTVRPSASPLRWILVGSGAVEAGSPPPNRAVLIDRVTGEIRATQDKTHRFNLTCELVKRWQLTDRFSHSGPLDEYIHRGSRYVIIESLAGRFAILICEDLTEHEDHLSILRAFGVSTALVPIFSQPIRQHHWEQKHASVLNDQVGSRIVVANSLAVPDPGGHGEPHPSLALSGETAVGQATSASDVDVFRFTEEGVVRVEITPGA